MDFNTFMSDFSGVAFVGLFFKAFALLFSLMFIIYAVVISKQTQVMNETLAGSHTRIFSLVSKAQIFAGVILFLLAVFLT